MRKRKVVNDPGFEMGSPFEAVITEPGSIELVPVAAYPKAKIEALEREARAARRSLAAGMAMVFDDAEDLIAELHKA